MKYIFYDIECANCQGGWAKICSFGYVVTDERFEILEKKDLIINPKAPFMLTGHKNRPYIKLAYERKEFQKAPDFPRVYDEIRALLSDSDCMIFGYAADNDANYLKCEFIRYSLPSVDFTYYDVQKLLRFALPETGKNQVALSDAAALFSQSADQEIHKSDEDALLTMQVLQGLVEKTGLSPVKLLEKYPVCRGDLKENKVLVRVLEGNDLLVKIHADKSDRIAKGSENRAMYTRFVRHVKPSGALRPQWLRGKRVAIPEKYAERHFANAVKLIQLICDCGGRYTLIAEDSHYFVDFPVYNDDGSRKPCVEEARILAKRPGRTTFLPPERFFSLCGVPGGFADLPSPELRYLLDDRYAPPQRDAQGKPSKRTPPVKKDRIRVTIFPKEED